MKTFMLTAVLFACSALMAAQNVIYSFPGGKFGKGPGLTVKGKTIDFAPVSRMYVSHKFDPAGGAFEITAKFRPVPIEDGKKYMHYLWSVRGNKRTVASASIIEQNGHFSLNFYVFDTKKKPISCACAIKFPADKSLKLSFFWDKSSIGIKINDILFAKKNYKGSLQPGEMFMIGTATKNRDLIPMTLENVKLYGTK